jgi:hypothetical protein
MSEAPQPPARDATRPAPEKARRSDRGPARPRVSQEDAIHSVTEAMRRDGRKVFAFERLSRAPNARVVAMQTPIGNRLLGVSEEFDRAMAVAHRAAVRLFDETQRKSLRDAEDLAAQAIQNLAEAAAGLILSSGATTDNLLDPIVKGIVAKRRPKVAGPSEKADKTPRQRASRARAGSGDAPATGVAQPPAAEAAGGEGN